jgi:ABC-type branched-subunit amino acid transport system permease subunit
MFAENNRISWSQMHCQCLLAALGMGLIWGIPEFIGREGAVGILIGGILLGVIESLSKAYISSQMADAIVFLVLIIILVVKPTGIFGKKINEKV